MVESAVYCCPECGSNRIDKDGLRYTAFSEIQRYVCKSCHYRFSANKSYKQCQTKDSRQVCAILQDAKNLGATTIEKVAGEKKEEIKGQLLQFSFYMKREGMAQSTIETFSYLLRKLEKNNANLDDPDSVKDVMAKLEIANNSKATMKGAYGCFLKFVGKTWRPPKYQSQQKFSFIPLESEIDQLVSGCGKSISCIVQTLKETGMRIGECMRLEWTDLNTENRTLTLNKPEKHGNPRILPISPTLINMLKSIPEKERLIFGRASVRDKEHTFQMQRERLSRKLGNPRLAKITFHTLRHWKGTMEYHLTHDPDHVKRLLGHKSLKSTEIYINMENAVFTKSIDEFHIKVASTLEDAVKLMEVGFEFHVEMEGKKIFRKRK